MVAWTGAESPLAAVERQLISHTGGRLSARLVEQEFDMLGTNSSENSACYDLGRLEMERADQAGRVIKVQNVLRYVQLL